VATIGSSSLTKLKPIQYTTVKGSTPVSVSKSETQNKAVTRTKNFSSSKVLAKQKTAVESVLDVKTKSKSKVALATATAQATDVSQTTQQKQSVVQATAQKVKVKTSVATAKIVPKPLLTAFNLPKSSPVKQETGGGFAVFVRVKGVFQRVGKKSFSESEARDLGAYTVANTARATFTLRPSSSPLGSVSSKVRGSFSAFKSNFLQKGGLFIEKKEKRIKTGGEKAGITRKGILANKNKGLFKGLKI